MITKRKHSWNNKYEVTITCDVCGERIDRGACDTTYTKISVRDYWRYDKDDKEERVPGTIQHLCDKHTLDLKIWIMDENRRVKKEKAEIEVEIEAEMKRLEEARKNK